MAPEKIPQKPVSRSEKGKSDFPVTGFLPKVPVAKFRIDDQLFLVVPHSALSGRGKNPKKPPTLSQNMEIVAELDAKGKSYIIIKLKNGLDLEASQVGCLTRREIQIVMLVADGKVNKEIADQLKISEYTVSTHLRRIFAKLGVDSRAAMIYRWTQLF